MPMKPLMRARSFMGACLAAALAAAAPPVVRAQTGQLHGHGGRRPVFRLLGAKDIGEKENYRTAKMPPVNTALLDGELAWRQHDGGHEDRSNMKHFIAWASRFLQHTPPAATATK
jgi:hypothetical protein